MDLFLENVGREFKAITYNQRERQTVDGSEIHPAPPGDAD